jgi:hypothetical protein
MTAPPTFRLRVKGQEYGPFSRSQIKAWLEDREIGPDDAVFDSLSATWQPLSTWRIEEEVAPDPWAGVNVASTYVKVTYAGAVLVILWSLVFLGIRLYTGKWPGQGAPQHHGGYVRDAIEDTSVE